MMTHADSFELCSETSKRVNFFDIFTIILSSASYWRYSLKHEIELLHVFKYALSRLKW
jgi:hypothetical protein